MTNDALMTIFMGTGKTPQARQFVWKTIQHRKASRERAFWFLFLLTDIARCSDSRVFSFYHIYPNYTDRLGLVTASSAPEYSAIAWNDVGRTRSPCRRSLYAARSWRQITNNNLIRYGSRPHWCHREASNLANKAWLEPR